MPPDKSKQRQLAILPCDNFTLLLSLESSIFEERIRDTKEDLEKRLHLAKILYCGEKAAGYYILEDDYLYSIGILPEFRRRGLAEFLLHKLFKETGGTMTLHVAQWNDSAISLYKKHGFVTEHIEENFYSEGLHACFMKKTDE